MAAKTTKKTDHDERNLRYQAMQFAMGTIRSEMEPSSVVAAAELYLKFLRGKN